MPWVEPVNDIEGNYRADLNRNCSSGIDIAVEDNCT